MSCASNWGFIDPYISNISNKNEKGMIKITALNISSPNDNSSPSSTRDRRGIASFRIPVSLAAWVVSSTAFILNFRFRDMLERESRRLAPCLTITTWQGFKFLTPCHLRSCRLLNKITMMTTFSEYYRLRDRNSWVYSLMSHPRRNGREPMMEAKGTRKCPNYQTRRTRTVKR